MGKKRRYNPVEFDATINMTTPSTVPSDKSFIFVQVSEKDDGKWAFYNTISLWHVISAVSRHRQTRRSPRAQTAGGRQWEPPFHQELVEISPRVPKRLETVLPPSVVRDHCESVNEWVFFCEQVPLQSPFLICIGGRGHMLQLTKNSPLGNLAVAACPNGKK